MDTLDNAKGRLDDDGVMNHIGQALSITIASLLALGRELHESSTDIRKRLRFAQIGEDLVGAHHILEHAKAEMDARVRDEAGNVLEH